MNSYRQQATAIALMALALALTPHSASAHAAPFALGVAWSESEGRAALLTNRGLIFGEPSQHSWRLMCNEALHINTIERPEFAYVPDGRLIVASSWGLRATADEGCTWLEVAQFGATPTPALAQDPSEPSTLYAATYGPGLSALRISKDAGATWTELMPAADNDFMQEILIAPSKHARLYVSGQALDTQGHYTHYVTRSDDGGKTWERHEQELLATEVDLTLLAVSPKDPDLILAIAVNGSPMTMSDRVLVSRDGGETFESPTSSRSIFAASFSADGAVATIAGNAGLLQSTDDAKTFAPVDGPSYMTCVFERDAMTFGCGTYTAGQDGIGISSDHGTSFEPWMTFKEVTEAVQCPAESETASRCSTLWGDWQREIFGIWDAGAPPMPADAGVSPQPDAGAMMPPAASDGSDAGKAAHASESGCAVYSSGSHTRGAAAPGAWLLALGALWQRRRA